MLSSIARFEARYQIRSPLFIVAFLLFFLLAFGSVTSENIQIGGGSNVHVNSPYALMQTMGILNLFLMFVLTAMVAGTILRDDETGFAPLVRATRMSKTDYLVGRFAGAMLAAYLVSLAIPLGNWVGTLMPWVDSEKIGPRLFSHYAFASLAFVLPTLLLLGALFFAIAAATRSMMWTFIGVVVFLVLFTTSRLVLRDPAYDTFSAWSDPFGLSMLGQITRYWTAAERNAQLPPVAGLFLQNRLLWLGIAVVIFGLAYRLFKVNAAPTERAKSRRAAAAGEGAPSSLTPLLSVLPSASPSPIQPLANGQTSGWGAFLQMARFEMAQVFKSPGFIVLLVIGLFNALAGAAFAINERGVSYLPVTRTMVNSLFGSFTLFAAIIAIFYAGELVWRDRERRIADIIDATPTPGWAFALPKVLAIVGVMACTYALVVLGSMAVQAFNGYFHFELLSYLLWFYLPSVMGATMLGVLAVFVQTLVPSKFIGWGVTMLYLIMSLVLNAWGFEHLLYHYAATPQVPLSDMNGMGHFWIAQSWFQAYWAAFAGVLLVLTHLLWRRGVTTDLRSRIARLPQQLKGHAGVVLATCALAWVGLGGWIYYNTNMLNRYETQDQREALQARMEKDLLAFEKLPQPTITQVKLKVDLFPQQLRADISGQYTLQNRTSQPLTEMHLLWNNDLKNQTFSVPGTTVAKTYPDYPYRILRFDTPLQPGEQRTLQFASRMSQEGFKMRGDFTRVVGNGSFLNNMEIAPFIGIQRGAFLQDRAKRRKYGLPPELRPAKLEDESANAHHYLRRDSDWVTSEVTLTTDADQVPVIPGDVVSDTTAETPSGRRRTLVARIDQPTHNFFSVQSARYAIARDTWVGQPGQRNAPEQPVQLAVYYHPGHEKNVPIMLKAMKASLDVFAEKFSPYQFKQARIIEFPAYAAFAQAFAATMPYSESIGFVQNFKPSEADEKIDLVTMVTAHEIAHQWWADQVIGADKQGMTLLSESFAEYSAMLVMERLYGKAQMRKFLKYELDSYLRNRGAEKLEELPLSRVENQPYIHYRKGAVVMYGLKEQLGEDVVNQAMRQLIADYAFKPAPYPSSSDFIRYLKQASPAAQHGLIDDMLQRITLYDLKATDAHVTKRADGHYDTRFTVEAKKLYADGQGKETESPLDLWIDVGAFTAEPGKKGYKADSMLLLERRRITSGKQTITLRTAKAPTWVGVDPFNVLIDRNSGDNLQAVGQ